MLWNIVLDNSPITFGYCCLLRYVTFVSLLMQTGYRCVEILLSLDNIDKLLKIVTSQNLFDVLRVQHIGVLEIHFLPECRHCLTMDFGVLL
jgi:glutaredoxin-related protein